VNIADLTKRLAEAGASAPVMAIAVEVYEYFRTIPDNSGRPTEYELKIHRRVDAWRRAKARKKHSKINENAEANDAANAADFSTAEMSGNVVPLRCLTSLTSDGIQGRKKGSKETNTRARGTRLPEDWQPSEADRKFARDNGIDPDWLRDEFVDFWTNIPGVRGMKLSWPKTWRARVRALAGRKTIPFGGRNGSSPAKDTRNDYQRHLDKLKQHSGRGNQNQWPVSEAGNGTVIDGDFIVSGPVAEPKT
jgi:hypothetical protein